MKFLSSLAILFLVVQTEAQLFPSRYFFPTAETVSVDGSSATGHCSSVTTGIGDDGSLSRCDAPTSSVLFDGNIPTLTGLDGDMWASQLLTLTQTTGSPVDITFDFTATPGYPGVQRIEVVMFNCPERGIEVLTIVVLDATTITTSSKAIIGTVNLDDASCDSLVRVCIPVITTRPVIDLRFFHSVGANFYLAEVTFYTTASASCTPGPITTAPGPITTTPDVILTTTASQDRTLDQTTIALTSPTSTTTSTCPVQCEVCPSCSTSTVLASVITAIVTALLATVIFVLVLIAVCKCHPKSTPGGAETGSPAGGEEQMYEDIDGGKGGVGDATYMEVGTGGGGKNTFQLKENEAYATHLQTGN